MPACAAARSRTVSDSVGRQGSLCHPVQRILTCIHTKLAFAQRSGESNPFQFCSEQKSNSMLLNENLDKKIQLKKFGFLVKLVNNYNVFDRATIDLFRETLKITRIFYFSNL